MKTILFKGEKRENLGSKFSKELIREGKVPCVLYNKETLVHFFIYRSDFKNLVYTPEVYKVKIDIEGEMYNAILQDIQFNPVNDTIIHADFLRVEENSVVSIKLPVRFTGNAPGVKAGGKLQKKITKMQVKGALNLMPEFIEVNIDKLKLGQSIKVQDISVENMEILDAKENAIVSCRTSRASVKAAGDTSAADETEDAAEEGESTDSEE